MENLKSSNRKKNLDKCPLVLAHSVLPLPKKVGPVYPYPLQLVTGDKLTSSDEDIDSNLFSFGITICASVFLFDKGMAALIEEGCRALICAYIEETEPAV